MQALRYEFIFTILMAGSLMLPEGPAFGAATAEKTLANCQKTVGKEIAKYVSAKQKIVGKCLDKIANERIKDAEVSSAGAAKSCVSGLRKLVNTEDSSKELDDKLVAKVTKKCFDAALAHTDDDILGGGSETVAGDAINASPQMAIPCLHHGGDGVFGTASEWLDCLITSADRKAIGLIHMQYPNADLWLRDVRPIIAALSLLGDAKATDALPALDSVRRWVDNGDGTVTDHVTGLTWEKKTDEVVPDIHDVDVKYAWSTGPDDPDGTAFTVFLDTLNGGDGGVGDCDSSDGVTQSGGFAGHCDWRVPTIAELQTILLEPYPCSTDPCIDTDVFGPTVSELYWSSTRSTAYPDSAWTVFFADDGYAFDDAFKTDEWHVRAVRGGL